MGDMDDVLVIWGEGGYGSLSWSVGNCQGVWVTGKESG